MNLRSVRGSEETTGVRRRAITVMVTGATRLLMRPIARIEFIDLPSLPPAGHCGFIIVANHRSLLDLFVGLIVFRHWGVAPSILVREDYFNIPVGGRLLRAVGGIPVGPHSGTTPWRRGLTLLRRGAVVMVMPEGKILDRRETDDIVGRVLPGVARLASSDGCPVLVVSVLNTDLAWPLKATFPKLHFRRSRRPCIMMRASWLPVAKGTPNGQVTAGIDELMRANLKKLMDVGR